MRSLVPSFYAALLALTTMGVVAPATADPGATATPPDLITISEPAPADAPKSIDTKTLLEHAGVPAPAAGDQESPGVQLRQFADQGGRYYPAGTSQVPRVPMHADPSCAGTGSDGKRVQVFYVREAGDPSRFVDFRPAFLQELAHADDIFAASSDAPGQGRRVRWLTDTNCVPIIKEVVVSAGALSNDAVWQGEMAGLGYDRADRKYLVFAEGTRLAGSTCGLASVYDDARPGQENWNNGRAGVPGLFARIDADCWLTPGSAQRTATHELVHMLGAVHDDAPHSTKQGHCFDDSNDVMCYVDTGGIPLSDRCDGPTILVLDCRGDDYFSVANPGTWLANHWNIANSAFLDTVPALSETPLRVAAANRSVASGAPVTVTASGIPDGTPVQWGVDQRCTLTPGGTSATVVCPASILSGATRSQVTAYAASRVDGRVGTAHASWEVTKAAAPVASIDGPASLVTGAPTRFDAVVTQGAGPFTYEWEDSAGCTLDGADRASVTITCPASADGQQDTVTLFVTAADGQFSRADLVLDIVDPSAVRISPASATMAAGETRSFTATGAPGATFAWHFDRTSLCSLASATGPAVELVCRLDAPGGTGTLRVEATTPDGTAYDEATILLLPPAPSATTATLELGGTAPARTVTGTLHTAGQPLAGAEVLLEKRVATDWITSTTRTTDETGQVVIAMSNRTTADYRLRFAGDARHAPSTSPVVRVPRAVLLGTRMLITRKGTTTQGVWGTLKHGDLRVAGERARIQRYMGGRWVTIGSRITNAEGQVAMVVRPRVASRYRVVFLATSTYATSVSATLHVAPPQPNATRMLVTRRNTAARSQAIWGTLRSGADPVAGARASIQRRVGGRWDTVATRLTDSNGQVALVVRPTVDTPYRIVFVGTSRHARAISGSVLMHRVS